MKSILILLLSLHILILKASDIDVKHLTLHLAFDWAQSSAIGRAEITCTPIKTTNKIHFDAAFFTINSISLNKEKVKYLYSGGDDRQNLEIILPRTYLPFENISLEIEYFTNNQNKADPNSIWGSFGKGLRFQKPTSTTPKKRKQIWSSGEPDHNRYWFPSNEDISDIHTTEIIATVEKPLQVISNGELLGITENANQTNTFHYKADRPFPNYLVSIVVGEYSDAIQKAGKTTIHNFGYPDEIEAVKATTDLLPDMLNFLESNAGIPYPFNEYSQVVVQDYPFPGLVGQHTASILSDNYIDDYGVHKDFKYLWDGVAVQALANQWFGNLIMLKSWDDVWLNNAFAQYFAGLYTEKLNSKAEYLSYILPFEKTSVINDWKSDHIHPIVTSKYKDLSEYTSDNYSKYRGALILRMLQKETGAENWWKSIHHYVKTNTARQVHTNDFQRSIEKITGKNYGWFFNQWVYKIGFPKLAVSKTYNLNKKQLILTVTQTQEQKDTTQYTQVQFFQGKIEIEIEGTIQSIYLKPAEINTYQIPLSKAPLYVNFNYEETFLCENEYFIEPAEHFELIKNSPDLLAKQRSMDRLVEIAKDSFPSPDLKSKIVNAIKNEITSKSYWRYRNYALASLRKIIPFPYDTTVISLLINMIKSEASWLKASAISTLGTTADSLYLALYIDALNDKSDRVINAAAIAIGKTKSSKAYEILMNLEHKHSWKNQNRISALNGLEQLGDQRAADYALNCLLDNRSPRWYLATPVWDYPFAAANTLVSLRKSAWGFPVLFERFKQSLPENDLNDIFQMVQLIDFLNDARGIKMYELLKQKFANDPHTLESVLNYEKRFLLALKEK